MGDSAFWIGCVILLGGAAALIPRRAGVPAAAAALVAGAAIHQALVWSGLIRIVPIADEGVALVASCAAALLGMMIGAECEIAFLARAGRSVALGALVQAVCATALVFCAGVFAGFHLADALTLGLAAIAVSPVAVAGVVAQERGRGVLSRRAFAIAPLSLLLAQAGLIAAGGTGDGGPFRAAVVLGGTLLAGVAGGLVVLIPASRLGTRGAMVACLGATACLWSWIALHGAPGRHHLLVMAVTCGLVVGNLAATRALLRETLRDLAVPCAVVIFAIEGATLPAPPIALITFGAVAVAAARWIALVISCSLVRGGAGPLREAAMLTPMAAMIAAVPALPGEGTGLAATVMGAALLTQIAGMPAAARALRRAGESAADPEAPEAWRAPMG